MKQLVDDYGSVVDEDLSKLDVRGGSFTYHAPGRPYLPLTRGLVRSGSPALAGDAQEPPPDQPVRFGSWLGGEPGRKTRLIDEPGTDDGLAAIGNALTVRSGG